MDCRKRIGHRIAIQSHDLSIHAQEEMATDPLRGVAVLAWAAATRYHNPSGGKPSSPAVAQRFE
jgi:hypothetical protein